MEGCAVSKGSDVWGSHPNSAKYGSGPQVLLSEMHPNSAKCRESDPQGAQAAVTVQSDGSILPNFLIWSPLTTHGVCRSNICT